MFGWKVIFSYRLSIDFHKASVPFFTFLYNLLPSLSLCSLSLLYSTILFPSELPPSHVHGIAFAGCNFKGMCAEAKVEGVGPSLGYCMT